MQLTQSGAVVGTPAYMAPEQARGEKVDARGDLFSLGCVLYKLCTGVTPFPGDTAMAVLTALATHTPKPVRDFNPDVPAELSELVMRLLAEDPAQRPQTAGEVIEALRALEGRAAGLVPAVGAKTAGTSPAARPVMPPMSGGRKWRPWVGAAIAAGFLATAVVATVVIIRYTDKDGKPQEMQVKLPEDAHNPRVTIKPDDAPNPTNASPPAKVDDAWIKQVAALSAKEQLEAVAAKLKELNPGFDGKVTPTLVEHGALAGVEFLTDDVTDLSPLRALPGLKELRCQGSTGGKGRLSDLSPLKAMKLTDLGFANNNVSDLSPLKDMDLTRLSCNSNPVWDLSPLKEMKLTFLDCNSTPVSDLSPLKEMKLTHLDCSGAKVSDLSPLKDMHLTYLDCNSTAVSDLSPLKGMPLTVLGCWRTAVSDLSPLKGMPLTQLHCIETEVSDLSPLRGMPLKVLRCDFKSERDADILRSIPTLENINDKPAADFWKEGGEKKP